MKNIFYRIFAARFNLRAKRPPVNNRVALLSPHMAGFTDSLGEIGLELERRGGYEIVKISGEDIKPKKPKNVGEVFETARRIFNFFTKNAKLLASSKYVFLNDNFMPLADMCFHNSAVLTQLWHAEGAFKKFGLDQKLPPDIRARVLKGNARLDYVVCSSDGVADIYAGAFGAPREKVLPYGSPRADRYLRSYRGGAFDVQAFKRDTLKSGGKLVVLYAPTFRDNDADNKKILDHFDLEAFEERFGHTHKLVLRLHPQMHSGVRVPPGVTDMTAHKNVNDLIQAADILVTDYSSICADFALLNKPCVFYAYDLAAYSREREFYFDYRQYVPGAAAETFPEFLDAIGRAQSDTETVQKFVERNFGVLDGKSAERIVDKVIGNTSTS
ncbi:MAG: CDP-glycerol glycerophosphotransferase family protein [Oscillospiraceae bacterium]|nr:CDP-glycerol glycerophosphotransferase family protein [Oscillospiraceae bacterium]